MIRKISYFLFFALVIATLPVSGQSPEKTRILILTDIENESKKLLSRFLWFE
jgi:hypothetical protein